MNHQIPLFISYAHPDEKYVNELRLCLDDLKMDLDTWYDGFLTAGDKWDSAIKSKMDSAEIVVFVLSDRFLSSDYIKKVEIAQVLRKKYCKIVNIVVAPVPRGRNQSAEYLPGFTKAGQTCVGIRRSGFSLAANKIRASKGNCRNTKGKDRSILEGWTTRFQIRAGHCNTDRFCRFCIQLHSLSWRF